METIIPWVLRGAIEFYGHNTGQFSGNKTKMGFKWKLLCDGDQLQASVCLPDTQPWPNLLGGGAKSVMLTRFLLQLSNNKGKCNCWAAMGSNNNRSGWDQKNKCSVWMGIVLDYIIRLGWYPCNVLHHSNHWLFLYVL